MPNIAAIGPTKYKVYKPIEAGEITRPNEMPLIVLFLICGTFRVDSHVISGISHSKFKNIGDSIFYLALTLS
jgi:hypothetical protein